MEIEASTIVILCFSAVGWLLKLYRAIAKVRREDRLSAWQAFAEVSATAAKSFVTTAAAASVLSISTLILIDQDITVNEVIDSIQEPPIATAAVTPADAESSLRQQVTEVSSQVTMLGEQVADIGKRMQDQVSGNGERMNGIAAQIEQRAEQIRGIGEQIKGIGEQIEGVLVRIDELEGQVIRDLEGRANSLDTILNGQATVLSDLGALDTGLAEVQIEGRRFREDIERELTEVRGIQESLQGDIAYVRVAFSAMESERCLTAAQQLDTSDWSASTMAELSSLYDQLNALYLTGLEAIQSDRLNDAEEAFGAAIEVCLRLMSVRTNI